MNFLSRNTASCSSKSCSSFWAAALVSARDGAVGGMGRPGIGMESVSYSVLYPTIFSYVIVLEEEKEATHDTGAYFLHSDD